MTSQPGRGAQGEKERGVVVDGRGHRVRGNGGLRLAGAPQSHQLWREIEKRREQLTFDPWAERGTTCSPVMSSGSGTQTPTGPQLVCRMMIGLPRARAHTHAHTRTHSQYKEAHSHKYKYNDGRMISLIKPLK